MVTTLLPKKIVSAGAPVSEAGPQPLIKDTKRAREQDDGAVQPIHAAPPRLSLEDRSAPRERLDDRDELELGRIRRERVLTEDHQVGLFPDRDRALRVFFEVLIGGPERNRVERL